MLFAWRSTAASLRSNVSRRSVGRFLSVTPSAYAQKGAAIALHQQIASSWDADFILSTFDARANEFNTASLLSAALSRLGKITKNSASTRLLTPDARLDRLARSAAASIYDADIVQPWKPHEIADACRGVAKVGAVEASKNLLGAVAAVLPALADFEGQDLANTLWSYARAGVEAPCLFEAAAAAAVGKVSDFEPQDLANTVWAFAKAGVDAPLLFEAVALEATRPAAPRKGNKIDHFNPQALANTAWAFSAAGAKAPLLFEAL
ncbi:hypothetical protein M885DRAFT_445539, partial [Pelagophyceae sp. CCMP2097]